MFSRLMAAIAVLLFVSATTFSSDTYAQSSSPSEADAPALTFLAPYYKEEAERYARRLAEQDPVSGRDAHDLWRQGADALAEGNAILAADSFRAALRLEPDAQNLWIDLTLAVLAIKGRNFSETSKLLEEATSSAVNAHDRSSTPGERAHALFLLAATLERRKLYRPALEAYKASLLLKEVDNVRTAYNELHRLHGFRIVDYSVDSDAAEPRICVQFSEALRTRGTEFAQFFSVNGKPAAALEAEGQQICIEGVNHGERYKVTVRTGIPSKVGELLDRATDLSIYVRDRKPTVRFTGRNFVLPRSPGHGIPLVTVNTDRVTVKILRIGDRALTRVVSDNRMFDQLSSYSARDLADIEGEKVWQGELDVERVLNTEVTTRFPIDEALPERKPGVYVMVAEPKDERMKAWQARATQWFVVSDIGLSTLQGADGMHVFARSLSTTEGIEGAELQLVARNNEVLGTAVTDAQGHAVFEPGLVRGTGGMAPVLISARLNGIDYAFLDVAKPGFDLSDRGVEGRTAPGPLDAFLYTERGIYRPGATVHVSALLRDRGADAVPGVPLTFIFFRPDGVEHRRMVSRDDGLGGHVVDLSLLETDMQGTWRVSAHADPKATALAEVQFLVEDFVPDRIEFDLETEETQLAAEGTLETRVSGRFLYGAPASGLALEGNVTVRPTSTLDGFDDYRFGLADEEVLPTYTSLSDLPVTDEGGEATVTVKATQLPDTTRPLTAEVTVRMREGSGRAVERRMTVPVERRKTVIGIRPHFKSGEIGEGETAGFSVIAVDPAGNRTTLTGLNWELVKIERNFQWYQIDGRWNYESVNYTRRVASGRFDLTADQPFDIASQIEWGRYRLEVATDDPTGPAGSFEFHAGWYVEVSASDTPDALEVSLDKPRYKPGETARVHLAPRFAGTALIKVVSDRLLTMKAVKVDAAETVIDLKVDETWGVGAYVTATLFRPADEKNARMPGRAIGVQWLDLDTGERTVKVELDVPDIVRPRKPMDVLVSLGNIEPGEQAYVTVAAVDVGILNLTGYVPPAPQDWYFGQRALGVELRDLYGQLIDGMQGVPGRIRSGGGGPAGMETNGSPPAQKPVSLFSGIVEADEAGRATVSFDLPEFNGTLRLMAVAWTKSGVGNGTKDVTVRDEVVVTASLPRFLAPGDTSQIRLDIDNTEGPAGEYRLSFDTDAIVGVTDEFMTVMLAEGERKAVVVPLTGETTGSGLISFSLNHPDGTQVRQTLAMSVRAPQAPVSERQVITLAPGQTLTISEDRLADRLRGTGSVSLAVSRAGEIDVPSLLYALDRYPYGCAEQTTSRALPLLYMSELAAQSGLGDEPAIKQRIQKAIYNVLASQSAIGSFGLWRPGSGDMWLDAYVSDFLTRAREQGYDVPERALSQALDNLQNALGVTPDPKAAGSGISYALYVLARNRRAALGDLRYYADTRLGEFATPFSKAQLGAALALYGENARATDAFKAATDDLLRSASAENASRRDYGSLLRDAAATLALAAETRPAPTPLADLRKFVSAIRADKRYTSTQENAWLLLAARALLSDANDLSLAVNGRAHSGNLMERLTPERLDLSPYAVTNTSSDPIDAVLTVTGVPDGPRPAGGDGFEISRKYYTLEGDEVTAREVSQNQRFVVVLKVRELNQWPSRIVVADLLPAGFEIDNPRLLRSADLQSFPWLKTSANTAHLEFRDDRFVAALNRTPSSSREFVLAYVVRAVTPGEFTLPPATVEDMYRPHLNARTEMGRIAITAGTP